MRRLVRLGGVGAIVGLVGLGAGCGGLAVPPDPAVETTSPTPRLPQPVLAGLDVELAQARLDWERRVVQVRVANESGVDVTVTEARLTTPGAQGVAVSARPRPVRDGVDRDLSVALGAARCTDEPRREVGTRGAVPSSPDGAASSSEGGDASALVELDVVDDAGRTGTWRGVPGDPNGLLARIHGEDCAAAAVGSGARLTLSDTVELGEVDGRTVGSVTLRLDPVPSGPRVEVLQVDGTVLLTPLGGAPSWPVQLDSSDGPAEVTLTFEPARCDPHAVAEDKRGVFLGIRTRVAGGDLPVFFLTPSDELRGAVHRFIGTACGWPDS